MHFQSLQVPAVWIRTDMRLHALIIPAWFAVLLGRQWIKKFAIQWLRPWIVLSLFVVAIILLSSGGNKLLTLRALLAIPVGFPLIVISTMLHPGSMLTKLLETWPLRFVGRISYSLFLWQQLFFFNDHTPARWPFAVLQTFPFNYLAAFACALASYYLIEKPLIRIGHRLAPPVSPGHQDLIDPSATEGKTPAAVTVNSA